MIVSLVIFQLWGSGSGGQGPDEPTWRQYVRAVLTICIIMLVICVSVIFFVCSASMSFLYRFEQWLLRLNAGFWRWIDTFRDYLHTASGVSKPVVHGCLRAPVPVLFMGACAAFIVTCSALINKVNRAIVEYSAPAKREGIEKSYDEEAAKWVSCEPETNTPRASDILPDTFAAWKKLLLEVFYGYDLLYWGSCAFCVAVSVYILWVGYLQAVATAYYDGGDELARYKHELKILFVAHCIWTLLYGFTSGWYSGFEYYLFFVVVGILVVHLNSLISEYFDD